MATKVEHYELISDWMRLDEIVAVLRTGPTLDNDDLLDILIRLTEEVSSLKKDE